MAAPGTQIVIADSPPRSSAPTDTGVWFVVGMSEKGSILAPIHIYSMADVTTKLGARVSYGYLYDALDVFFREGGRHAVVGRVVGPAPVSASHMFQDAAGTPANTLQVLANSPGAWGNNLTVAILDGGSGTFKIQVSLSGTIVETSPAFSTKADAIVWAANSAYITLVDQASALNPAPVAAQALTAGTDDHANAVDAQWQAALDRLPASAGPGQVSAPGRTTDTGHAQLIAHAKAKNRTALLDLPDTATVATLTTSAGAARTDGRYGAPFAPWALVPGLTPNTYRTVPYSAVEAGIIARNDAAGLSPNVPAAGNRGQSLYAIGLSQPAWNSTDRDTLNTAGVNVARVLNGFVETYGYLTLADQTLDPIHVMLSNRRLDMAIVADGNAILEQYVFEEIDGPGFLFGRVAGELGAMMRGYFNAGSLYGATEDDAYDVEVASVNTPQTAAARQLNATITYKRSPFAEDVVLTLVARAANEGVS